MYKVPFSACEKKNDAVVAIVDNAYANIFTPGGVCHRGRYYKMMWSSEEKTSLENQRSVLMCTMDVCRH